jgi:glutamate 5-kinase
VQTPSRAAVADARASLRRARRVVVKLGSAVLCGDGFAPRDAAFALHADAIAQACADGREVVLVSSGAVGLGRGEAGQPPTDPAPRFGKQALAAIGQPLLMSRWRTHFGQHGRSVAQLLLTHGDLGDRGRFLHARRVTAELLAAGVVPIVNENDTIAIEELRFGDNDALAAQVAAAIGADLLVLLTEVDGLYDADPRENPAAKQIPALAADDPAAIAATASGGRSDLGTGGMRSKVLAAAKAAAVGIPTVVAHGARPGVLAQVLDGAPEGTLFLPGRSRLSARRKWLATSVRTRGTLHLDDGAARALLLEGRSLLPVGVRRVEGRFGVGDAVRVLGPDGTLLGRGLCRYTSEDATAVVGLRSDAIAERLGWLPARELVHRDDFLPAAIGREPAA